MAKEPKINFSSDNKKATVKVDDSFSASEVQNLITLLAMARNKMTPEVPRHFNEQVDFDADTEILIEDSPDIEMFCKPGSDRIRFKLRNRGIGWLIFELPFDTAISLRDFLISQTVDSDDASSCFIPGDFKSGGRSH